MAAASPSPRFPASLVLAAMVAGFAARLAFGLLYWTHQPLTRDELEYLSLARSLAAGHGFVYDEVMRAGSFVPFGRAPGYPAFLALIGAGRTVVTAVPVTVKVAQAAAGAVGVWLAAILAFRLAGARAAAATAAIAALYPPLVWIASFVWSEALFWPLGLLIAWLFDRATARGDGVAGALLCGVVTGAAILTRPVLIVFLPLAGVFLIVRRDPRALAGLALGVALVIGPWTARNYVQHHRLMIVASDGGVTFWTGNNALAIGEGDMAANPVLKQDNLRLRAAHPNLTEEEMEPLYYREALQWIRARPASWLWLEVKKAFYLVVPIGPSYTLHSRLYYVSSIVSYGSVLILALVGAARLGRGVWRTPGLWMLAGSAALACLVFFPQERFRIPVIDPALVVLAGAGIAGAPRARTDA